MNEIRAAREDDFAAVRGLLAESALVHEDLTLASLGTFVVPTEGDLSALAAVAGLETFRESREGLLRSVAMSLALRMHGMGVCLVATIKADARRLGMKRLWLLTTTAPDFSRRHACADARRSEVPEPVQQSNEFKSLCPSSAVCLSKWLSEEVWRDLGLHCGCLSSASLVDELRSELNDAGYASVRIEPKNESREFYQEWAPGLQLEDAVVSALIEAVKP